MSLLDNDDILMEKTDPAYFGFPAFKDWDEYKWGFYWYTDCFGGNLVYKGLSANVLQIYNISGEPSYFMIYINIYTSEEKQPWRRFANIKDRFETFKDAKQWAYGILCFLKEKDNRSFFDVLKKQFPNKLFLPAGINSYELSKSLTINEIYNYKKYESIR